jgi:hypothetical protein
MSQAGTDASRDWPDREFEFSSTIDPDGKPKAGAKLVRLGEDGQIVDLGVTAADGRFRVALPVRYSVALRSSFFRYGSKLTRSHSEP